MRTPLAAIVGVAERPVAPTTELTHFELVAGAAREAMLDAGCLPSDIDGRRNRHVAARFRSLCLPC